MRHTQQVNRIIDELVSGSNVALLGGPGIGKSSLLREAEEVLEAQGIKVIRVDLQSCDNGVHALEDLSGIGRGTSNKNIVAMWTSLFASIDPSKHHVFVLDEFDAVTRFDDANLFIRSLREHFQFSKRTSMAIASRRPLRVIEEHVTGISTLDSVFTSHHPSLLDELDLAVLWPNNELLAGESRALLEWSGGVRSLAYCYYNAIVRQGLSTADIEYERVAWASQMVDHCEKIELGTSLYQYVLGPIIIDRPLDKVRLSSMSLIGDLKTGPLPTDRSLWNYPTFVAVVRSRQVKLTAWGKRGQLELEARRLLYNLLSSTGLTDAKLLELPDLRSSWWTAISFGVESPSLRDSIDFLPENGLQAVLASIWKSKSMLLEPDDLSFWMSEFRGLGGIGQMRGQRRNVDEVECEARSTLFQAQRAPKPPHEAKKVSSDSVQPSLTTYNVGGNLLIAESSNGGQTSVTDSGNTAMSTRKSNTGRKRRKNWFNWIAAIASVATIAGFVTQLLL